MELILGLGFLLVVICLAFLVDAAQDIAVSLKYLVELDRRNR